MTLEDQLFEDIRAGKQVEIERALLIASGCDTEKAIARYQHKIETLSNMFKEYAEENNVPTDEVSVGKALLEFIWRKAENIFFIDGMYDMTLCIDSELSEKKIIIGNCLTLSSIYAMLAMKRGWEIKTICNNEHIMLRAKIGEKFIDIDCGLPSGFGIKIEQSKEDCHKGLKEEGLLMLISQAYCNRGYTKAANNRFEEAIEDYSRAIEIIPKPVFYNNRGAAKAEMGDRKEIKEKRIWFEAAIADYNTAIEIDPEYACAFCNTGDARLNLGDYKEAIEDYSKSIRINQKDTDAFYKRAIAKKKLGDLNGAKEDFAIYKKLTGESQ